MADSLYLKNLDDLKRENKIRDTDDSEDDRLNTLVERAFNKLDNDLRDVLNSVPLTASDIDGNMELALIYLASAYYQANKSETKSRHYLALYESELKSIKNAKRTAPETNTRTAISVLASSYKSEPLKTTDGDTDLHYYG